ncbi:MAG: hypothetical protein K8S87_12840, partial [Planctomycetes bacterium]|nr:hypothetical protein [Planctomycetota bacterium]
MKIFFMDKLNKSTDSLLFLCSIMLFLSILLPIYNYYGVFNRSHNDNEMEWFWHAFFCGDLRLIVFMILKIALVALLWYHTFIIKGKHTRFFYLVFIMSSVLLLLLFYSSLKSVYYFIIGSIFLEYYVTDALIYVKTIIVPLFTLSLIGIITSTIFEIKYHTTKISLFIKIISSVIIVILYFVQIDNGITLADSLFINYKYAFMTSFVLFANCLLLVVITSLIGIAVKFFNKVALFMLFISFLVLSFGSSVTNGQIGDGYLILKDTFL